MTLAQAVVVVPLVSGALVWPVRRVRVVNALSAVGVPLGIANFAYWVPAWLSKSDLDQYGAWAPVGVGLPFVPALLISLTIVAVAEWRRRRRGRGLPV